MADVLIVDDDEIIAEYAAQVLTKAGFSCNCVSDAKAAMDQLSRQQPDLILLDQNMPGESGASFLRRLRGSKKFRDIPVIMLTGVQGVKDEQHAYYNGAQDYVRKPFGANMLVYRVRSVLDARQAGGNRLQGA